MLLATNHAVTAAAAVAAVAVAAVAAAAVADAAAAYGCCWIKNGLRERQNTAIAAAAAAASGIPISAIISNSSPTSVGQLMLGGEGEEADSVW